MRKFLKNSTVGLLAVGSLAAVTPITGAHAATIYKYQHGLASQKIYASMTDCNTAKTAAPTTIKNYGGVNAVVGLCHPIDMMVGGVQKTGYLFEATYDRANPIWIGDKTLGLNPPPIIGQHSFKVVGSTYTTQALAVEAQNLVVSRAAATDGGYGYVTYKSPITYNSTTKLYSFEVDYNARTPYSTWSTQISESPYVTNAVPVTTTPPTSGTTPTPMPTTLAGLDVSGHTVVNDWAGWKTMGVKFIYAKSTEGTGYKNPKFAEQYNGAANNGMIRGAYHFALPNKSDGATQANYFLANGGGWSSDGKTLPGALDIEWNPYGATCYNMTQAQMRTWVNSFVNQYKAKTGVKPTIYTATNWWNQCVGADYTQSDAALWVPDYKATLGALPTTWSGKKQAIWQTGAVDAKGYDTNKFNGGLTALQTWAKTGVWK